MGVLKAAAAVLGGALALLAGLVLAGLAAGAGVTAFITARVEGRFPPAGRFVAVPGGRLAVIEAGPGEGGRATVVLLHGASATASDPMEGVGRRLAEGGFRVLAFDRPGHGWSDRLGGEEAGTPAFQAAAIASALEAMGVGPAIVFGHSWSGALALRLALDRPDRVTGLVLAAPVALPFPARGLPLWARFALSPPIRRLLAHTVAVPFARNYLATAAKGAFAPQPVSPGYLALSRAPLNLRPGAVLANLGDLTSLPAALAEQAPRYGEIRVPTVIVAGDADAGVRLQAQAAPLGQRIPGARLVRLPGVGHMVHYVASEAVVEAVESVAVLTTTPR